MVRHLLKGCAVCSRALEEVRKSGGLSLLLDAPLQEQEEAQRPYNYEWAFARIRRAGVEKRLAQPEFIQHLIEKSHEARYRSPQKTLHWALLARNAAEACTAKTAGGEAQLADLRTRAWGQYSNALRISGAPIEAEKAFTVAQGHREAGTGDPRLRAWLIEKITPLAIFQNRFEEAIRMCEEAGGIYRELGESHCLASTLVQKAVATLYSSEVEGAIDTLDKAIPLIDPDEDPLLLLIAHHNLARCYIDLGRPDEALALHSEARPLYREFQDPLIVLRATWQEGALLREIGHLHNAEAALLRARQGFTDQGLAYEAALVCLELVEVYRRLSKAKELRQVIAEATQVFQSLRLVTEVLASQLGLHSLDMPGKAGRG